MPRIPRITPTHYHMYTANGVIAVPLSRNLNAMIKKAMVAEKALAKAQKPV